MRSAESVAKSILPRYAKEIARKGLRNFGIATAESRRLPDYLIVGTKRGGTTSLWRNLLAHPDVRAMYPSWENLKSPHYFDINYGKGEAWYRSHFPLGQDTGSGPSPRSDRLSLCGDASPYYLFHPLAAARAHATVPGAKILVLLRNPTDRAYSHYWERRAAGTETLDFYGALLAEAARTEGEEERILQEPDYYSRAHDYCSYLARGRYLEQLDRWMRFFPEDSILILRSEDLYSRPDSIMTEVHQFLGLRVLSRSKRPPSHSNNIGQVLPEGPVRSWLDAYYRPHVAQLENRLGRDFRWQLDTPPSSAPPRKQRQP